MRFTVVTYGSEGLEGRGRAKALGSKLSLENGIRHAVQAVQRHLASG
jgi:hypothetical protein